MKKQSLPFLSKSKYLNGLQCEKLLWYAYNDKDVFPPIDPALQARFDDGKLVGEYAWKLFPGGIKLERVLSPEGHHNKSLQALTLHKPLFEAGFISERTYALADILMPGDRGMWDLYEVKSATSVKDEYYHDLAFQKLTYDKAGLKISKCFVVYINNDYVKRGEIDPKKLFEIKEVTQTAADLKDTTQNNINHMLDVISLNHSPDKKIGPHCNTPYDCPLKSMCWKFLPEKNNVFVLSRGKTLAFDLVSQGILDILEIPAGTKMTEKHLIQIESHRKGSPYIDKEAIGKFMAKLEYPLYFLDFETIGPSVPVYDHTSPYEQIPFQFSLHVADSEAAQPKHFSYLAKDQQDPRPEILKKLKELLGGKGSIVAYNSAFEVNALKNAASVYPLFKSWFNSISLRVVDLLAPFRGYAYYHPDQQGSNSIKDVLPALTGTSYENLEIADGAQASRDYYKATFDPNVSVTDREKIYNALETYCYQDTQGMIDILKVLEKEAT